MKFKVLFPVISMLLPNEMKETMETGQMAA